MASGTLVAKTKTKKEKTPDRLLACASILVARGQGCHQTESAARNDLLSKPQPLARAGDGGGRGGERTGRTKEGPCIVFSSRTLVGLRGGASGAAGGADGATHAVEPHWSDWSVGAGLPAFGQLAVVVELQSDWERSGLGRATAPGRAGGRVPALCRAVRAVEHGARDRGGAGWDRNPVAGRRAGRAAAHRQGRRAPPSRRFGLVWR
jgi:hypothetical protein